MMIAASYKRYIGTAIAVIVYGSELGVMIAANKKMRNKRVAPILGEPLG